MIVYFERGRIVVIDDMLPPGEQHIDYGPDQIIWDQNADNPEHAANVADCLDIDDCGCIFYWTDRK